MGSKLEPERTTGSTRRGAARGMIPSGQVVILKESELDCDLATAIERVRAQEETSRSRILIVAPENESETRGEGPGPRTPPPAPTTAGQIARRGEEAALRSVGVRLEPLLECLERFFGEFRGILEDLGETVADAARASLAEKVRVLSEVLDWSRAVTTELETETRLARAGYREVDTHDLLVEMSGQVEAYYPGVRVTVQAASGPARVQARAADLAEAFFLALSSCACRIGGRGALTVEIEGGKGRVRVRLLGHGRPHDVQLGEAAARLRQLLVVRHGARILPDRLGPGGTGLTLDLPVVPTQLSGAPQAS